VLVVRKGLLLKRNIIKIT